MKNLIVALVLAVASLLAAGG